MRLCDTIEIGISIFAYTIMQIGVVGDIWSIAFYYALPDSNCSSNVWLSHQAMFVSLNFNCLHKTQFKTQLFCAGSQFNCGQRCSMMSKIHLSSWFTKWTDCTDCVNIMVASNCAYINRLNCWLHSFGFANFHNKVHGINSWWPRFDAHQSTKILETQII